MVLAIHGFFWSTSRCHPSLVFPTPLVFTNLLFPTLFSFSFFRISLYFFPIGVAWGSSSGNYRFTGGGQNTKQKLLGAGIGQCFPLFFPSFSILCNISRAREDEVVDGRQTGSGVRRGSHQGSHIEKAKTGVEEQSKQQAYLM